MVPERVRFFRRSQGARHKAHFDERSHAVLKQAVVDLIDVRPVVGRLALRVFSVNADFVVISSGVVEIALGASLVLVTRWRVSVGWIVAIFFVLVFPGNISQFVTHANALGLNSDLARGIRLLFQPLLVIWALWCTGAWAALRNRSS